MSFLRGTVDSGARSWPTPSDASPRCGSMAAAELAWQAGVQQSIFE